MLGWNFLTWLHLMAIAFFVGGQLFMAAVVLPVLRGDENREKLRLAARRFGYGTLIAFVVLIVTGSMLAGHFMLWGDPMLHLKLTLVGVIIVLLLVHMKYPKVHALEGVVFLISLIVAWLGVLLAH
jgi:uncharacterized membrane protein